MPLILGANQLTAGGYEIDNSVRFNHASSDELARTMGTATDGKKCTISFWIKKCRIQGSTTTMRFMQAYSGVGNQFHSQWGDASTSPGDQWNISPGEQGSNQGVRMTNATYRDPSAWYHYLWYWDSVAQLSTLYVNGVEQSSSLTTAVVLNQITSATKSGTSFTIKSSISGQAEFYLAEFYIIDGQALDPTYFGETDEDTNIWKPKEYTGTFGNNGCYLDFKDSSNLGNDVSGNNNDFTVTNLTSIDQTTDTPTNNFATFLTLNDWNGKSSSQPTISEGNLKFSGSGGWFGEQVSSIAISTGKWYWEITPTTVGLSNLTFGIVNTNNINEIGTRTGSYGYASSGEKWNGSTNTAYGATWTANDVIGVAFDATNGTLAFYKNGTSQGNAFTGIASTSYNAWFMTYNSVGTVNFGSPVVSSNGYTDGAGYGNFSYAVPSGYYSLCTKNLAEFG